ncbi:MAG: hypothetical protein MPJ50_18395 [Pirellulales bacterium]|nr:hypothetical protein [Pirellulales bacterium]
MRNKVFETMEFEQFAANHLICCRIFQPSDTSEPSTIEQDHQALCKRFGITKFPVYQLFTSDGSDLGRVPINATAWRFVELVDMVLQPDQHRIEVDWLMNIDSTDDITVALNTARQKGKFVLHYMDSSKFNGYDYSLMAPLFSSSYFKRFARDRLVLLKTRLSHLFPPRQHMDDETLSEFKGYIEREYQTEFDQVSHDKLDRWTYSEAEYQLRSEYGFQRSQLPGFVILDVNGQVAMQADRHFMDLIRQPSGVMEVVRSIQRSMR